MKKKTLLATAVLFSTLCVQQSAHAGAKIVIDKDSNIDLGFRVQTLYINNDENFRTNDDEFRVRRARFRLKANVTKWWTGFLQTDFSNDDASPGGDTRLIDAWARFKPHKLIQITGGQQMGTVTRMNLTGSGGLMAIDRPGINNYLLTWGTSGRAAFNTGTLPGTGAGLAGDVNVRDLGFSLFGSGSFAPQVHAKYYLGVYEGSKTRARDHERYTARAQINFFDPEPGFFNTSTYLGKKKTLGFGAGTDVQEAVAVDVVTGRRIDYRFYSFDGFFDHPLGPGALTVEAAYSVLDLDDAVNPLAATIGGTALGVAGEQAQGDGFYAEIGYYITRAKLQPWVMFEEWKSDGVGNAGNWDALRVGVNYYFKGHNANIKAAYEVVNNDTPGTIADPIEDKIETFVVGFYLTY